MFGPVTMANIVGRVIYCLRTAVDHGPVQNRYPIFSIHICLLDREKKLINSLKSVCSVFLS